MLEMTRERKLDSDLNWGLLFLRSSLEVGIGSTFSDAIKDSEMMMTLQLQDDYSQLYTGRRGKGGVSFMCVFIRKAELSQETPSSILLLSHCPELFTGNLWIQRGLGKFAQEEARGLAVGVGLASDQCPPHGFSFSFYFLCSFEQCQVIGETIPGWSLEDLSFGSDPVPG